MIKKLSYFLLLALLVSCQPEKKTSTRENINFNSNWKFHLGDVDNAEEVTFPDKEWRELNLPHDWGVEGKFSENHPAGTGGGALPGGIGWYRKSFQLPDEDSASHIFIEFGGVYQNSDVYVNGHHLGNRPNGYISFRYELTPYLTFGDSVNTIAVKVDNSKQPNSRWYSGSGIYRNVNLLLVNDAFVDQWGTFVSTPNVSDDSATVDLSTTIRVTSNKDAELILKSSVLDSDGKVVAETEQELSYSEGSQTIDQQFTVQNPHLWSDKNPYLYSIKTTISQDGEEIDVYHTPLGIRSFSFDVDQGFVLNGKRTKIRGVCNHHDLGALGTAFNRRAAKRQLEILKSMGCNGIRTAHNPPAEELLELCDSMGFIVMDETFDMWAKGKSDYDYHLAWEEWHEKDLRDHVQRDRNHPSIFVWSVGNEIQEQWGGVEDTSGRAISRELVSIVKELDTTRPITTANNEIHNYNNLIQSQAFELIGYNYNHEAWATFHEDWPGKKFIVTESTSALQTRGHYDMPSDSMRLWPVAWDKPLTTGNSDTTCSAYDNCHAPWGSTHEASLVAMEKNDHVSGMYIWTGFDYLGEPTPYTWPARSSYFGIMDLAGFPKDSYYLYKSVWTEDTVLHVFPHWNWEPGKTIDVWAYYNNADEVELFLNGESLGTRSKETDSLHVMWRLQYQPGTIRAVSRKNGQTVAEREIKTAGKPAKIIVEADRENIHANSSDLSFVSVKIVDKDGVMVPDANNLIKFDVSGEGFVASVDNGHQTSHQPFKAEQITAFNGRCLAIVQATDKAGKISIKVSSEGLESETVELTTK